MLSEETLSEEERQRFREQFRGMFEGVGHTSNQGLTGADTDSMPSDDESSLSSGPEDIGGSQPQEGAAGEDIDTYTSGSHQGEGGPAEKGHEAGEGEGSSSYKDLLAVAVVVILDIVIYPCRLGLVMFEVISN